ncbi:MAG: hypothetical protein L0Y44_07025 [Phycisphaerales bacterium]|nr:hypothetical protein [Phycisphaerales bacterium]MCI0630393.1 hypothetical protein [Phycisphaerales bacterium]MCI0675827.1 hypothetical protein [Phycisphaerales bacterium]
MSKTLNMAMAICCGLLFLTMPINVAGQDPQTSQQHQAQARQMVQEVLDRWDWKTWDQLLADDVTLTLKLGTVMPDQNGELAALGMETEYNGREDAKKALKKVYGELKKNFTIEDEVISGNEAVFVGDLNVSHKQKQAQPIPMAVYLEFNDQRKIKQFTIATVDLRPLTQTAVSQAPGR